MENQRFFSATYWHFTGSPCGLQGKDITSRTEMLADNRTRKTPEESVKILRSILKEKRLAARATESIGGRAITDPFCCVTDIPLKDLLYHSKYYGCVAVGFRQEAIRTKFLPVLYYPKQQLSFLKYIIDNEAKLES